MTSNYTIHNESIYDEMRDSSYPFDDMFSGNIGGASIGTNLITDASLSIPESITLPIHVSFIRSEGEGLTLSLSADDGETIAQTYLDPAATIASVISTQGRHYGYLGYVPENLPGIIQHFSGGGRPVSLGDMVLTSSAVKSYSPPATGIVVDGRYLGGNITITAGEGCVVREVDGTVAIHVIGSADETETDPIKTINGIAAEDFLIATSTESNLRISSVGGITFYEASASKDID